MSQLSTPNISAPPAPKPGKGDNASYKGHSKAPGGIPITTRADIKVPKNWKEIARKQNSANSTIK